jgi:hypothetical protein
MPPPPPLQDTDEVDFLLSMSMTEFGNCIMQLLATLIFIAVVQPWILVGIAPLMLIYYFLQKFYRWGGWVGGPEGEGGGGGGF